MKKCATLFIVVLVMVMLVSSALAQTAYYLYSVDKVAANTTRTQMYNTSHWEYWSQGASGYATMRSGGCRVVAYSKMLVEMGIASSNTSVFNPDKYFEWGVSNGFHSSIDNVYEEGTSGNGPVTYAANKGTTIKKVSCTFSTSADLAEKARIVQKYLDAGYYVVMRSAAHYAYIGRAASQRAGEPIVLNSWSSYVQYSTQCYYLDTTSSNFTALYAYWKGSNPPTVNINAPSFSINYAIPTDSTYVSKIVTGNDNAVVVKKVTKTAGCAISDNGMVLFDTANNVLNDHVEPTNTTASTTNYHMWFSIGAGSDKDVQYALRPGTTYNYKFFVTYNNVRYYSDMYSFTTTGQSTCTVYLNANGGSVSPSSLTCNNGGTLGALPTPTRDGYAFIGWFDGEDNGSQVSADTLAVPDQTLYAMWQLICTVTLDAGEGTVSPQSFTKLAGDAFGDLPIPSLSAYEFLGWFTQAEGGSPVGASDVCYGSQTLFAHWNAMFAPLAVTSIQADKSLSASGENVTWTVNTAGGRGNNQYQYRLIKITGTSGSVVSTSAWGSQATFTSAISDAGLYAVNVSVTDGVTSETLLSAITTVYAPLSVTSVTATKTAVATGSAVTWNVDASGGLGTKQYFYRLYLGSKIINIPTWSESASFTFTLTQTGSYALSVVVKDTLGSLSKTSAVTKAVTPLVVTSVTPSATLSPVGSAVTWSVTASGGDGAKQYRYILYRGSEIVSTSDWLSASTYAYTPTVTASYAMVATVRDSSASVGKTSAVTRVIEPLSISAVTPGSAEVAMGTAVTWTVSASGGIGTRQYSYKLYRGSTVINTPAWVSAATFTYSLPEVGSYALNVSVRDSSASVAKTSPVVKAGAVLSAVSVTPSATEAAVGTPLTWTVSTTGGNQSKQYSYKLYKGSAVVNTPAWTGANTFAYTPTDEASYALSVTVRDGTITLSKTSAVIKVNPAISIASVTPSATAVRLGASVTWTVKTNGGGSGKQYAYKLYRGAEVINTPAWVDQPTFTYTLTDGGSYALNVSVKDNGRVLSKTSAVTKAFTPVSIASVTASHTVAGVNTELTWNVVTEGGSGNARFSYKLYRGSAVVSASDNASSATFVYTPTEAGVYALSVTVREDNVTVKKTSSSTNVIGIVLSINTVGIGD